ncbi:MAG: potassium transporter Kup [Parvibaculaceae bacterium]
MASESDQSGEEPHSPAGLQPKTSLWTLALGSIGVVYGDIGTSPLYAFREALLAASEGGAVTEEAVYGISSLILWALFIIVTLKYAFVLLHADNRGEGGTLALMALARRVVGTPVLVLGLASAALFYGDALITPAISVLSAVEGLKLATPEIGHWVVPLTVLILIGLFAVQSHGTARVATFFGPLTCLWFLAIAVAGIAGIGHNPEILGALNPWHAVSFLITHGEIGIIALGAVFLAVTGAEALYADLGHFGRKPIQVAWLSVVLPALVINYLGQAALVLERPETIDNPFYRLVPDWALLPMVGLATVATVIASQAVITGAYSISRQAVRLGLLPRLEVRHTSETQEGQIYMPQVNLLLLVGVLALVLFFESSAALATAYGIAVTGTMVVTATMAFIVIWRIWNWPLWSAVALMLPLLCIDLLFLVANLFKINDGGWMPVLIAAALMVVMWTWMRGSRILFEKTRRTEVPLGDLIERLERKVPPRVPGTAIFLTSDPESTPTALLHSLKHYKVLHQQNLILTVVTASQPRVEPEDRIELVTLSPHFTRVQANFGFMESPNLPEALAACRKLGWKFDIMSTSFFLSRRRIRPSPKGGMPLWQDKLFILLARNASDATEYFRIPTGRAVEIGTQVTV